MATTTNNGWSTPDDTAFVYQGAQAMRTLGQDIDTSVGDGLKAWIAWTPTISGTGWVRGTSALAGRYCQIGKTVHFEIVFTIASGFTAGTGALSFALPINAQSTISPNYAHVVVNDLSASTNFAGMASIVSSSAVCFVMNAAATYTTLVGVAAGAPVTFAIGDDVRVSGTYECV